MAKIYCVYCGQAYESVTKMIQNSCAKHPNGFCKGKHVPYEGTEKAQYTCKYCGQQFPSIAKMVNNNCTKHPDGFCKGKHSPML